MKKTVTILSAMLVCVAVFFCVPVNAASNGSPGFYKTASGAASGVSYEIVLDQYYPIQTSDTGPSSAECYINVFYRITNSNDEAAYVKNTSFTISWSTVPYIERYETYSDDLLLGYQNQQGSWYIYADSPYSYGNGVVVPPHSSLYCAAVVVTTATVNGSTVSGSNISSVSFGSPTITLGDYPYGDNGQTLEEIEGILEDVRTALTFGSGIPAISDVTYAWKTFQFSDLGATLPTGVSGNINILRLSSFSVSETIAASLGTPYRHDTYVIPFQISVNINNNREYAVSVASREVRFEEMFDRTALPSLMVYGYDTDLFESPRFQAFTTSNYVDFVMPLKLQDNDVAYIPRGHYSVNFTILCIFDSETPSYSYNPDMHMSTVFNTTSLDLSYNTNFAIDELNRTLLALYNAYSQVNGVGDLSDNSNDLTEGLNNAHQAEQNYFSDNSQALAASGISNPNFEAADRTGINSAIAGNKNQFVMLWNAIGPWRNIYVYAALMCLVTYLLRHRPWIRSGSGNYDSVLHDRNGGK